MKNFILFAVSALSLFNHFAYADTAAGDGTAAMVQSLQTQGVNAVTDLTAAQVKGHYWITASAKQIIDARNFDTPDPQFDLAAFNTYVTQTLSWAIEFYATHFTSALTEMHFALDDLGNDRQNTACETYVNTRYVHCDIRRIHKMYKGFRAFLFPLVLVHEYTHANQYANLGYPAIPSSNTEAGRPLAHDRELKAIAVEIAGIIQHDQNAIAFQNYARTFQSGCTPALYDMQDETLLKQTGRRCLMLTLWSLLNANSVNTTQPAPASQDAAFFIFSKINESNAMGFTSLAVMARQLGLERASDHLPVSFELLKEEAHKLFANKDRETALPLEQEGI